MAFTFRTHNQPQKRTFGQKVTSAAHTVKKIWDVGSGIYNAYKVIQPIVSAVL